MAALGGSVKRFERADIASTASPQVRDAYSTLSSDLHCDNSVMPGYEFHRHQAARSLPCNVLYETNPPHV